MAGQGEKLLAGLGVPDTRLSVSNHRELPASRVPDDARGNARNPIRPLTAERASAWRRGRIPDLDRPIGTSRRQAFAISTKGHAIDLISMTSVSGDLLTRIEVPESDRLISTSRRKAFIIGAERYAKNLHSMGSKGESRLPRMTVPNPHVPVTVARS
jgi:hypothetical protein